MDDIDLYQILRCESNASAQEIEAAYRSMLSQAIQDRGGAGHGDAADPAWLAAVRDAYRVLSDLALRQAYDRSRHSIHTAETDNLSSAVAAPDRVVAEEMGEPPPEADAQGEAPVEDLATVLARALPPDRLPMGLREGIHDEGVHEPILRLNVLRSHEFLPALSEPQMHYLLLDIASREHVDPRPQPINLCLVIDRSTSMKGERLQQVKQASIEIIDHLGPDDIFSVVTFSDRAQVVLPGDAAMDRVRSKAQIHGIQSGGGTEIYRGLLEGVKQVAQTWTHRHLNHVILLTDGRTYGDEEDCLRLAKEAHARRIGMSTVGIGSDWNDRLLDELARYSGGGSSFLQDPADAVHFFRTKVRQLGDTLAEQVYVSIRTDKDLPVAAAFRIAPTLDRLSVDEGRLILGPLFRSMGQTLLLEMLVPPRPEGEHRLARIKINTITPSQHEQTEQVDQELALVVAGMCPPDGAVPARIINAVGKAAVSRLEARALKEAESGSVQDATRTLQAVAGRLTELGESGLAQIALHEAQHLSHTGMLSEQGKKELKYGTRSLSLPARPAGASHT